MKIILCDTNADICAEWEKKFKGEEDVSVVNAKFQDLAAADILVCPGNSFGIMDGGMDAAIRDMMGMQVQTDVQAGIRSYFWGEMPPGSALFFVTGNIKFPFIIYASTMRLPSRVPESNNAYLAMLGTMIRVQHVKKDMAQTGRQLDKVVIPGFCGGSGAMRPSDVAGQMWAAYHNFRDNINRPKSRWEDFIK